MDQELLLFSMTVPNELGVSSAKEALLSFGLFTANPDVQPLFPGNKTGKAIPVMVEGEYFLKDKTGKYRKICFTEADIRRIEARKARDVPFNYDHKRVSGPEGVKGWLRLRDHSYVDTLQTADGPRVALFAVPELSAEAVQHVENGIFRDVSIEYREIDDVPTGCALTSYPVMRNVQFYSEVEGEVEPGELVPVTPAADPVPASDPVAADFAEQEGDNMDLSKLSAQEKQAVLKELLAGSGLDLDKLVLMGEALVTSEAERVAALAREQLALKASRVLKIEARVQELVGDQHYGLTNELATLAVDVLAWAQEDASVSLFSDAGSTTPDPTAVLEGLLTTIGKQGQLIAKTLGASPLADGNFGEIEEPALADPELNTQTVNRIKELALQLL